MPRALFDELRFTCAPATNPGGKRFKSGSTAMGYDRCDVVSAAGEYAVRGGIIDVFAASAGAPDAHRIFRRHRREHPAVRPGIAAQHGKRVDRSRSCRGTKFLRDDGTGRAFSNGSTVPTPHVASLRFSRVRTPTSPKRGSRSLRTARDDLRLRPARTLGRARRAGDDFVDRRRARRRAHARATRFAGGGRIGRIPVDESRRRSAAGRHRRRASHAGRTRRRDPPPRDAHRTGSDRKRAASSGLPPPSKRSCSSAVLPNTSTGRSNSFRAACANAVAAGESIAIVSAAVGRTTDLLRAAGVPLGERLAPGAAVVGAGSIDAGFSVPSLRLRVLGDREIYGAPPKRVECAPSRKAFRHAGRSARRRPRRTRRSRHRPVPRPARRNDSRRDARLSRSQVRRQRPDARAGTQMHQIAKYSAAEGQSPRLSKMGGADWARTKARVAESLGKIADGLVHSTPSANSRAVTPLRPIRRGKSRWRKPSRTKPTPDQQKAIDETKSDMESARPMDRLVCGDVGYGKTEVAMRAAFKAVADKKQVAVLVPTTLLADQHYRTFSARFARLPVARRRAVALPEQSRTAAHRSRTRRRQSRHRRRHAPARCRRTSLSRIWVSSSSTRSSASA